VLPSVFADLVVLLHALFVVFAVFGALAALWWRWAPLLHLPAAAWGVAIELGGWICPLTPLENSLRRAAGEAGYTGGFVEHHLIPILYPAALTSRLQWMLAAGLVAANLLLYAWVVHRMRRASVGADTPPSVR
jgi:hypothetical protein